jgi:hypothetical protein
MGLLQKVRILVGALVHKPFTPRPEKADLGQDEQRGQEGRTAQPGAGMEAEGQTVVDRDRVAELIAQRDNQKRG